MLNSEITVSYSLTPVSAINPKNASFINLSSLLVTSSLIGASNRASDKRNRFFHPENQLPHLQYLGVDSWLLEIYYNKVENEQQFLFPDHMHRQECQHYYQ